MVETTKLTAVQKTHLTKTAVNCGKLAKHYIESAASTDASLDNLSGSRVRCEQAAYRYAVDAFHNASLRLAAK